MQVWWCVGYVEEIFGDATSIKRWREDKQKLEASRTLSKHRNAGWGNCRSYARETWCVDSVLANLDPHCLCQPALRLSHNKTISFSCLHIPIEQWLRISKSDSGKFHGDEVSTGNFCITRALAAQPTSVVKWIFLGLRSWMCTSAHGVVAGFPISLSRPQLRLHGF
jgi:hypothetical protein